MEHGSDPVCKIGPGIYCVQSDQGATGSVQWNMGVTLCVRLDQGFTVLGQTRDQLGVFD